MNHRYELAEDADEPRELLIVDHGQGVVVARGAKIGERFLRELVDVANSQIGLLHASRDLIHVMECQLADPPLTEDERAARKALRAAIAKAEGGVPPGGNVE